MLRLSIKFVMLLLVIITLFIAGSKAFAYGEKIFDEKDITDIEGTEVVISIPSGATVSEVGEILKENGLIEDTEVFLAQSILFEAKFYAGNYTLNTADNVEDIIEILKNNQSETISKETTVETATETVETTITE